MFHTMSLTRSGAGIAQWLERRTRDRDRNVSLHDVSRDVSRDVSQDVSRDVSHDVSRDVLRYRERG